MLNYSTCTKALRRFEGKVAVIMGKTNLTGRYIALGLRNEGAKLMISTENEEDLKKWLTALNKSGNEVCGYVYKEANEGGEKLLLQETLNRFGQVHILVHNIGRSSINFRNVLDVEEECNNISCYDHPFNANIKRSYLMAKLFAPEIAKAGGGSIIFNTSDGRNSICEQPGPVDLIIKSTLLGLTKALADSLEEKGVRVNAIVPNIHYPLFSTMEENYDMPRKQRMISINNILCREFMHFGWQELLCSSTVEYLCSDEAKHITGTGWGLGR